MTDPSTQAVTRALKKYEAEARALTGLGEQAGMDIYSPFGPMLAKLRLPDTLVNLLNEFADEAFDDKPEGGELIVPEAVLKAGGGESLGRFLADSIVQYVETVESSRVTQLGFEAVWIVSQYAESPSPVHFHSADISGVLYLRTPEVDAGQEERNYIGGRKAGYINFINGNKQPFNKSLISFKPVVGDLYIFPGWLMHGAEAFKGSGERRSLAFNAHVKTE